MATPSPTAACRADLATSAEVAAYLRHDSKTLADWRSHDKGPDFIKYGRNIRYRWEAVYEWVRAHEIRSGH